MNIAFLYPGQGAQFPGMAKDLYDHSAAVRDIFAAASDTAGKDMAHLLFHGSEEDLKQTDNTQIAITVANLAAREVLREFGVTSNRSAGFSLGEYASLVDAGVLASHDALHLVLHRGRIMEAVSRTWDSDEGRAGMAAAMGLDLPDIERILHRAGIDHAYPSLYNSPVQTVIGGTPQGLRDAADALKEGGVRRMRRLHVSGPFHTPLMEAAREQFADHVRSVSFSHPTHPVYSNVTGGEISDGEEARVLCLDQLVHTVRWTTEERTLLADGAELLLEVGPGSVLQGLWNAVGKTDDQWPMDRVRTAGTLEEIEAIAKELQ
ncbi:MAG: ACP S-malonyltransferase [Alkalispirochaeta sp.]